MLSAGIISLLTKVFVIVFGIILGWFYANTYDASVRTKTIVNNVDSNEINPVVIPDDVRIAAGLAEKVRILCLVPTTLNQHKEDATAVKNTWGSHCNRLLFVTNEFDEYVNASNAIAYNITLETQNNTSNGTKNETKQDNSWPKLKTALQYIYNKFDGDFDWVLKAEQTNYVIVENVRYMLHNISSEQPNVVARLDEPAKINSSAYVLSKEAIRVLVVNAFANGTNCSNERNVDNNELTKINECLTDAHVNFIKSQDAHGRELFLNDTVLNTIQSLISFNDFRTKMSNFTAVWPKASAHDLFVFNFLIFEMRSYGASQEMPPL